MNKFIKFLKENKVLLALGVVLIICAVVVSIIAVKTFYGTCDDAYCKRKVADLRSSLPKDIENTLKENENITKVSITVENANVYIKAIFKDEVKMDAAKVAMDVVVPLFTEEELKTYCLQFTIQNASASYTLTGARNKSGSGAIIWSNYNIKESSEESA